MQPKRWLAWIVLACLLAMSAAVARDQWLHVYVDEDDGDETVRINIPLDIVATILPLIDADGISGGKVRIDTDDDLEGIDLSELADALRDAPDADFVTVERDDEIVRVTKDGDFLLVLAEERGRRSGGKVRVRMPLAVLDAMADDDGIDLIAALEILGEYEGEALIDIESDDGMVKIWIDSDESGRLP